ncbi:MAG: hypothetical protein ACE5FO_09560 [Parvularculaceae bacterium]
MNRVVSTIIAAFAVIALAGCYESSTLLLDASAARQPISNYDDWTYTRDGATYHARLNPRSDGWYDYEEAAVQSDGSESEWTHYTVLLNYLESTAGMDVYIFTNWDDVENAYIYGLVAFFPDGRWRSFQPGCDFFAAPDENEWEIDVNAAQSAGAELRSDEFSDICYFTTSSSLFAAMRTVAHDPGFRKRMKNAID